MALGLFGFALAVSAAGLFGWRVWRLWRLDFLPITPPLTMSAPSRGELPIIQAMMDLIQWFVPLLNRLPRDHRFALGDRLVQGLYDLLEGLAP